MSAPLPENTRIERATEADLPAIARLARKVWLECYPEIISKRQIEYMLDRMYSLETLRREIVSENICYERLMVADKFIGFASFGPVETHAFKLHKLYLYPKQHGHGFGRMLLQHCEGEVRKLGAHRLTLNVNKRNARAIALYQRSGFSVAESIVVDIGGGFVMDDYVMAKELSSS